MSVQQPTLTQVNAEFLQGRADRLDAALSQALQSRLPPPPKPAASAKPATAAASSATTSKPSAETPSGTPSASVTPAEAPEASPTEPSEPASETEGAQEGAAEEPESPFDPKELTALAKKDRRALEKKLGLAEGTLGATNADYAAYRRRVDEVSARETAVEEKHHANTAALIAKYGPLHAQVDAAGKGDLFAFGRAIEMSTGLAIEQFIQLWAKNVRRVDPQVLDMQRRLKAYESQGAGGAAAQQADAPPPAPAPAAPPASAQAKADAYVAQEAKGHAALSLKGGAEEVRKAWLASYDKRSQSFGLTPAQAADAVLKERKATLEQEQWLLSGKKPPPKPRTRSVSRTGAAESSPAPKFNPLDRGSDFQSLLDQGAAEVRRQKAVEAARRR